MRAPSRMTDLSGSTHRLRMPAPGWVLVTAVAVVANGNVASAQPRTAEPQWTLMRGPSPISNGSDVCLASGGGFASEFSYKRWKAMIDPVLSVHCDERFVADLPNRRIYFAFDGSFEWAQRELQGGPADARCKLSASFKGYTPCNSRFFAELPGIDGRAGFRVMDGGAVMAALEKTGAIDALEKAREDQRVKADQDRWATYAEEFERATTLEDIASFERRYELVDKDLLIPKLQPRKQRLLHERYVAAFNAAGTPAELTTFIERYRDDDPDGLIPKARQKIAADQARQKALADKEAAARLVEARLAKQKEDQRRVAWCRRSLADAYATLDRERQIEAVSGIQNLMVKRRAGETIVFCQQVIGRGH